MTKRQLNATKPKEAGVHSTHGKEQLLFVRAIIYGVLCAAYIKNGESQPTAVYRHKLKNRTTASRRKSAITPS